MRSPHLHHKAVLRIRLRTCLAASLAMAFPLAGLAADPVYDTLVQEARSGNTTALLGYLREHEQQNPLNANQVADWLQVANWAGQDTEVVKVWQRYHDTLAIPARGEVAVARSYRNLKQYPASLARWESALAMEPQNDDIRAGWVMTMADARHYNAAVSEARQMVARAPTSANYEALAYAYRAQGKSWDALFAASRAQEENPQNKGTAQFLTGSLSANRVSSPALELSESAAVSPEMGRRLQTDAAAEMVRTAFMPTRTEQERYLLADKALSRYDRLLNTWRNDPAAQADYRRARVDRLGALMARGRVDETISEYEAISADGQPVPAYAKRWVASAYLTRQRPDKAEVLMNEVFRSDNPKAFSVTSLSQDDTQALFYTRMENGDYEAAKAQIDELVKNTPYLRRYYGSPTPEPNDYWLLGQTLQAQYRAMTNDLPAAEELSERLARSGPGNQGLRIGYASVLETRGLPRRAERELKIAEVLDPKNLELERQQAYVAMDLYEWEQARLLIDDVMARSPQDQDSQRLARLRDVHDKMELRIAGSQGIDSDSPISGQHDFTFQSALYSPPINENVRLFAGFNFATGEFEEGKGYNRDVLGGVEWRSRDNWAEAEISGRNFNDGQKIGARLSGWHDFNDNWRVGGSAERISRNTPLRALRSGVTANGGDAFVRWYQNERREYQLSVAPSWFSDGNDRFEYSLSGHERLFSRPRFTLDFTPSISGSFNNKEDVNYYNPKRDLSLVPGLTAEHLLYHHYDNAWTQQLYAGAGSYMQKGQGSGLITTVGYGQRVQWNNVVEGGFMLTWDRRPYDGERERNISVSFDLNVRF